MTRDIFDDAFAKHFGTPQQSHSGPPQWDTNTIPGSPNHFKYLAKNIRYHHVEKQKYPDRSPQYKFHEKSCEDAHGEMHDIFTEKLSSSDYVHVHSTANRNDSDQVLDDMYLKKVLPKMPMTGRP